MTRVAEPAAPPRDRPRTGRRDLLRAVALSPFAVLGGCRSDQPQPATTPTPTPTPAAADRWQNDYDIWHLLQNLTFLQTQFLSFSAFGAGLAPELVSGVTPAGSVTGGQPMAFTDAALARFARELAFRKIGEVTALKTATLGPIGQPAMTLSSAVGGGFDGFFGQVGGATGAGGFEPYTSDTNWLLAALLLSTLSLSLTRALAPRLLHPPLRAIAVETLLTDARATGALRGFLAARGRSMPALVRQVGQLDLGLAGAQTAVPGPTDQVDLVVTDRDGAIPGRDARATLAVLYHARGEATRGGFFPASIAGNLRTSG